MHFDAMEESGEVPRWALNFIMLGVHMFCSGVLGPDEKWKFTVGSDRAPPSLREILSKTSTMTGVVRSNYLFKLLYFMVPFSGRLKSLKPSGENTVEETVEVITQANYMTAT